jgi:hypothetical protein
MTGWVAVLWLMQAGAIHRWVQSERHKRFDWMPLLFQPAIVLHAWTAYASMRMVLDLKPVSHSEQTHCGLLAAMLIGSAGLAFALERSRRYVPREPTPEPPPPSQTPGKAPYRELQIDWLFLPVGPLMLGIAVGECTQIGFARADSVGLLAAALLAVAVFASLSIRTLTVGAAAVTYRLGPVPLRYRAADVVSCMPAHHETFSRIRDKKMKVIGVTDGRCVEITMANGRVYRLAAIRPTHICELIGKPAAPDTPPDSVPR